MRQKEIWQALEAEMTRKEKEKEQVTLRGLPVTCDSVVHNHSSHRHIPSVFFHIWQEKIAAVISELDELRGKFQHAAKELDRRVASEAALMARVAELGRQTEHLTTEKTSLATLLGSVETALEETEKKLAAAVKEKKRNAEERDEAVVQLRGARLQLADAEREAGNARAKEVWHCPPPPPLSPPLPPRSLPLLPTRGPRCGASLPSISRSPPSLSPTSLSLTHVPLPSLSHPSIHPRRCGNRWSRPCTRRNPPRQAGTPSAAATTDTSI